MIEGRCGACFPTEALERLLIRRQVAGQDLGGDGAFKAQVFRAIHLTHATRAERLENLVRTEPITGGERHPRDYGLERRRERLTWGSQEQEDSGTDVFVTQEPHSVSSSRIDAIERGRTFRPLPEPLRLGADAVTD